MTAPVPGDPQPTPKPRRWPVWTALGAFLVIVLATWMVNAGDDDAKPAAPAVAAATLATVAPGVPYQPVPNQSTISPLMESLAEQPADEATEEPAGPWKPCNMDDYDVVMDDYGPDGCKDITEDACDGAYSTSKQEGQGGLLDVMIENDTFIDGARFKDCPQFAAAWKKAQAGFGDGEWEVGAEVKAGTYVTTADLSGGKVVDCYWERSGANGRILANNMVTAAKKVTVTIRKSDEMFTTRGCGDWVPAG